MPQWGLCLHWSFSPALVIEAQVHQQLRAFLRDCDTASWPHHLTLARLVARALRLGRSALLQVGGLSAYQGEYRLSYLIALLMWPGPAVLVAPRSTSQRILLEDLPRLQEKLVLPKPIQQGDRWPQADFAGLLLTTPEAWWSDRLGQGDRFPDGIPTLLDDVDHLELWLRQQLTASLTSLDWTDLALAYPRCQSLIQATQVALTHSAFQRPANPYHCHLLGDDDCDRLRQLHQALPVAIAPGAMPPAWQQFWQQFSPPDHLLWFRVDRQMGQVSLNCAPVDLATPLGHVWERQPVVLIGASLDTNPQADIFRQRFGLDDLTCLKFNPHRHNDLIQLYLPDHLPLPNTPQFQAVLYQEICRLLSCVKPALPGTTLILIDDLPLKDQLAASLAGEFGSRVRVESTDGGQGTILVSGWEFWQQQRGMMSPPALIIIATLPLPSLEDPLVAGRVAFHKRRRQDWFRLYLLPTALAELQRAIAPLRLHQGMVALLDTRVHYRSYGSQILEALSPAACTRTLPANWSPGDGDGVPLESV
nr:ATP-dependent DNA helicase [Nodosilinea sp. P-1105]